MEVVWDARVPDSAPFWWGHWQLTSLAGEVTSVLTAILVGSLAADMGWPAWLGK